MSLNVLDDEDDERPVKRQKQKGFQMPEIDNTIPIIVIMGLILVGAMWISHTPCPECNLNCPNITIPETPACPNTTLVCNPAIIVNNTCDTNLTNSTECLAYAKTVDQYIRITYANASNTNQNISYNMTFVPNATYKYNELNWTYINSTIGENITIIVNLTA